MNSDLVGAADGLGPQPVYWKAGVRRCPAYIMRLTYTTTTVVCSGAQKHTHRRWADCEQAARLAGGPRGWRLGDGGHGPMV